MQAGIKVKESRGHEVYRIASYSSLKQYLGDSWHLRVLNKQYDFCYVILETVLFHLHQRKEILDPLEPSRSMRGGYVLVFHFVRGNGVQRHWDAINDIQ